MLDDVAVTYLAESMREDVRTDCRKQVMEAGCKGTHAEVLALLGSRLVDLYSREMLTTSTLEPVMTLQGFFRLGDFPMKRKELPNGGFEPLTTPPGATTPVEWTVLEAALMALYSAGCIVTGEAPRLLVVHLTPEVTGRSSCFAVTALTKPYACQAAWAAATMDPYTRGVRSSSK